MTVPASATGVSLLEILDEDKPVRDSLILGMFGGPVCTIDGSYSLFLYPVDLSGRNLHVYTLAFAHMTRPFDITEMKSSELVAPFDFTKGIPVMKVRLDPRNTQVGQDGQSLADCRTVLFDLDRDPGQTEELHDPVTIERLKATIARHFDRHDAPAEIYDHFGIDRASTIPNRLAP